MSKNCFYNYEKHKSRQQELIQDKTKEEVQKRYDHFVMVVGDMETKNMHQKVPQLFQQMKENLSTLSSLISSDPFAARDLSQTITGQLGAIRKQSKLKVQKLSEKELALEGFKAQLAELEKEASSAIAKYQEDAPFMDAIVNLKETLAQSEESTIQDELQTIRAQMDEYILNQESKKDVANFIQDTLQKMNFDVDEIEKVDLDGETALRLVAKNDEPIHSDPMASFECDPCEQSDLLNALECEGVDFKDAYSFSDVKKVA